MHENHIELLKDAKLTDKIIIEGVGSIEEYGELNIREISQTIIKK